MALRDDQIDAGIHHLQGVLHGADDRHHLGAVGVEPIKPRPRIAETRRIDRHPLFNNDFHLRFEEFFRKQRRGCFGRTVISLGFPRPGFQRRYIFLLHEILCKFLVLRQQIHRRWTSLALIGFLRTEAGSKVSTPNGLSVSDRVSRIQSRS